MHLLFMTYPNTLLERENYIHVNKYLMKLNCDQSVSVYDKIE